MPACRLCTSTLAPGQCYCPTCGTFTPNDATVGTFGEVGESSLVTLDTVDAKAVQKVRVGLPWDFVWGGEDNPGLVPTSTTLLGGPPGLGKTTMLLQISSKLIEVFRQTGQERWIYYLSAEQGGGDIRVTGDRLKLPNIDHFLVMKDFGGGAGVTDGMLKKKPPAGFVLDSVSALVGKDVHAAVGIAKNYKRISIKNGAPSFLISHITKEFDFAGLTSLQHEVDTLVTIHTNMRTGERQIKAWKNRNGPTHQEFGLVMTNMGLESAPSKSKREHKSEKDWGEKMARAIDALVESGEAEVIIHQEAKKIIREAVRNRTTDEQLDELGAEADELIDELAQPTFRKVDKKILEIVQNGQKLKKIDRKKVTPKKKGRKK